MIKLSIWGGSKSSYYSYIFSKEDKAIIKYINKKNDEYLERKLKEVRTNTLNVGENYKVGFVCVDEFSMSSILGHEICKQDPTLDFAALVYPSINKVSFRSNRKDIDLGQIAKTIFGKDKAGGQKQAASGRFGIDTFEEYISDYITGNDLCN